MPAAIARSVTRLFPEISKKPAEFLVNAKLHGMTAPVASYAVKMPTTVPDDALLDIVELLMLIVIYLPIGNMSGKI